MSRLIAILTVLIVALLVIIPVDAVYAGDKTVTTHLVQVDSADPDTNVVYTPTPGASIRLTRSDTDLKVTAHTGNLKPGVYTNWWLIFNNPDECEFPVAGRGDKCGLGDWVFDTPGVDTTLIRATGKVVGSNGNGNFAASIKVGDLSADVHTGPGLLNPRGSEVHYFFRWHGEIQPGIVDLQISRLNGGCSNDILILGIEAQPGDALCFEPQFVVAPAP